MIDIVHNNTVLCDLKKNVLYGTYQRIRDLCQYMNNNQIQYMLDNQNNYNQLFNIFSSILTYEMYKENNKSIPYNAIMMCATNIMEPYKKRYDILIKNLSNHK